jgi:hypothetical protein
VCSSKKIACNGYDDSLVLQWFPYQINQQVKYTDLKNHSEILAINAVDKSQPTEITTGGYGNNRVCDATYRVTSYQTDSTGLPLLQIFGSIIYDNSGNAENKNLQLIFMNERFDASYISDTGFVRTATTPSYISTQFFNIVTLNTTNLTNVQLLQIDTNIIKPAGIRSVYLSKNNGIVAYIRYPSNELWVKQ